MITSKVNEETYVNIDDLIALFEDIRAHPEKYNKDAVVIMIGQLAGKIPLKKEVKIDRPFQMLTFYKNVLPWIIMKAYPKKKIAVSFVLDGMLIGTDVAILKRAMGVLRKQFPAVDILEANLVTVSNEPTPETKSEFKLR